jgi:3-oxoadipate enol-lactonase/4-carboxymuconolactone decarboxylase
MPFATREGVRLYWKVEGEAQRPPLLLLSSIGTDLSLWDRMAGHLLPHFRLLRMDMRGHGASDAPDGDYSLRVLADDAVAVLDAAGVGDVHVAGVSLGGMVAMELALAAPDRVKSLALICTSAAMDRTAWAERVERVRASGTADIADLALSRFLSAGFAETHGAVAQSLHSALIAMDDRGYAGAAAAIRDMDLMSRIARIDAPTLVLAGEKDVSTPAGEHSVPIAERIAGARLARLDTGHLAPLEAPADVATTLLPFLVAAPHTEQAEQLLYASGLANRRAILGDDWVDASLARQTEFDRPFQAFITRTIWHEVWGRPGLEEKTRRLLVIAITAATGRWEEFRLHVRAGLLAEAFTPGELSEALVQLAAYAGAPAANTAFAEAKTVLEPESARD